ncbi:hypothetical protein BgiMline_023023, partial [Biomphalaria glabrata]
MVTILENLLVIKPCRRSGGGASKEFGVLKKRLEFLPRYTSPHHVQYHFIQRKLV